ncbi:MAG: response regulator [Leptolyngbyaceae cyanobacterium]
MELDKEQQARLTFLAEAEIYFEEIETVLLGLKTADDRLSQINIAMRAAHSVKGTAGMMGFTVLSQVAHQLEDSFKILRARRLSVDTSLETLLLQAVDCLRAVRHYYHDDLPIEPQWLTTDVDPVFAELNQRLGDLTPEDEARLLSEENDINLDIVIFTTSVEDCIEEFQQELTQLDTEGLRQATIAMAQRMSEFGLMAQLDPFISLCDSVQQQCREAQPEAIEEIAQQTVKAWQRSHALVLLGRTERMPHQLKLSEESADAQTDSFADVPPTDQAEPAVTLPDMEANALGYLHDQLTALETLDLPADMLGDELAAESSSDPAVDLAALQAQFAALAPDSTAASEQSEPPVENLSPLEDGSTVVAPIPLVKLSAPPVAAKAPKTSTVRISVEQLRQINSTFEALILDRNAVNLKLNQLHSFSELMQERMIALASFNKELRQWYDQASTEGAIPERPAAGEVPGNGGTTNGNSQNQADRFTAISASEELDVLEFDRYSKLHLLAQEHMETIVKLEEVSRDVELGLSEIGQAMGTLNYTSRTLKNRITQTQMRPFEEIVGRFPRVVRDWSVQYDKPVQLKLEGGSTLIEQFALDQLSDPLTHLMRNAFDHGIEPPNVRQAQGKAEVGTIGLRAINRGNRVVITLSDDGGGIDLDRVRDRIRKYNLPAEQIATMDHQELLSFIFEPGFSTSSQVTELSGRGFGMDVVRTNLKELQGDIQVATAAGKGTTFTISIPLSLSIFRVMLLERSGSVFALPVDMVQEVIRTPDKELTGTSMAWRDEHIPLIRLDDHWAMRSAPLEMSGQPLINCPMVVVVDQGQGSYGLAIDRFWQEQEVAVRSVASPMPLPPGFGGVTVLGDGRVIPLLEPVRLMEWIKSGPQLPKQPSAPVAPISVQSRRILVVDDSIHARRYLATTLERSGYLVEQAKDGQEAVDKLLGGLAVAAVICDIEMPRLDGYGVLEELRDNPDHETLPILMLTSRSSDKHRKLAMNLGATAYFSKPYNEQELLQELRQLTRTPEPVSVR